MSKNFNHQPNRMPSRLRAALNSLAKGIFGRNDQERLEQYKTYLQKSFTEGKNSNFEMPRDSIKPTKVIKSTDAKSIVDELHTLWTSLSPGLQRSQRAISFANQFSNSSEQDYEFPELSVIIPAYNHEDYISSAIQSIRFPEGVSSQIVVIDDGSTDDTLLRALETLILNQTNYLCLATPNRGAHAALNLGMSVASGKLLSFLNSDDVYHPDRLLKIYSLYDAEDRPQSFAVTTLCFGENSSKTPHSFTHWNRSREVTESWIETLDLIDVLLKCNPFFSSGNLAISAALVRNGFKFHPLRHCHDYLAFIQLALEGNLQIIPEGLYGYRVHDSNTIRENHLITQFDVNLVVKFAVRAFGSKDRHTAFVQQNPFYDAHVYTHEVESILSLMDIPVLTGA